MKPLFRGFVVLDSEVNADEREEKFQNEIQHGVTSISWLV